MTTQVIKAMKVPSIIATVWSQIPCQLTAKMICGLKYLTFADSGLQNATSFNKVYAGIKQACSQVLRFGRQNKLLGGKIFVFIAVYVQNKRFWEQQNVRGTKNFMGTVPECTHCHGLS